MYKTKKYRTMCRYILTTISDLYMECRKAEEKAEKKGRILW